MKLAHVVPVFSSAHFPSHLALSCGIPLMMNNRQKTVNFQPYPEPRKIFGATDWRLSINHNLKWFAALQYENVPSAPIQPTI